MMISTLKWREEFKVDELVTDDSLQEAFSSVGCVFGNDKEGRPVTCVPFIHPLYRLRSERYHLGITSMEARKTPLPCLPMFLSSSGTAVRIGPFS